MILRRTATAALTIGCLALAACSSSDDAGKSSAPTGSSPAQAGSSSGSGSAPAGSSGSSSGSGDATLAAVVVQQGELPSTFTGAPADSDSDDSDAQINACLGAKSTKADEKTTVRSQDFSAGTASISSKATRFGSQASVTTDVANFTNPKIKSCFTKQLQEQSKSDPSTTLVSSDIDVTPGTNGGPSNVVATITGKFVVESQGKKVPVYVDSVYITGPKLEVEITFTGLGTQFDSKLATTVASAVAKRAANA